jgi:hypothetical protein
LEAKHATTPGVVRVSIATNDLSQEAAMPLTDVAPISANIEIAAPPTQVWSLVSDLRNMAQWSPQTSKSILRGPNGLGVRFLNINRTGLRVWPQQDIGVTLAKIKAAAES